MKFHPGYKWIEIIYTGRVKFIVSEYFYLMKTLFFSIFHLNNVESLGIKISRHLPIDIFPINS